MSSSASTLPTLPFAYQVQQRIWAKLDTLFGILKKCRRKALSSSHRNKTREEELEQKYFSDPVNILSDPYSLQFNKKLSSKYTIFIIYYALKSAL